MFIMTWYSSFCYVVVSSQGSWLVPSLLPECGRINKMKSRVVTCHSDGTVIKV